MFQFESRDSGHTHPDHTHPSHTHPVDPDGDPQHAVLQRIPAEGVVQVWQPLSLPASGMGHLAHPGHTGHCGKNFLLDFL